MLKEVDRLFLSSTHSGHIEETQDEAINQFKMINVCFPSQNIVVNRCQSRFLPSKISDFMRSTVTIVYDRWDKPRGFKKKRKKDMAEINGSN